MNIFGDYNKLTGPGLNMHKVMVIPLWAPLRSGTPGYAEPLRSPLWYAKQETNAVDDRWDGTTFCYSATHRGFELGPEAEKSIWNKAMLKYRGEVLKWAGVSMGLFHATMAYNVYILLTLMYIAQLASPPDDWAKTETLAFSQANSRARGLGELQLCVMPQGLSLPGGMQTA